MSNGQTGWLIRRGRDADGLAMIGVIWSCWSAYPGIRMDVAAEMPELRALATYYAERGGALWVAEAVPAAGETAEIAGMIAARRLDGQAWEICRVYVSPKLHGSGLGHALLDHAEGHAIAAGAERLLLWSDTRFDRAHRFYEKRSYVRSGPIRVLNDISNSLEFAYGKPVNGVELLDIAAAGSAAARMSEILLACVHEGASVSFLAPLAPDKAKAFWRHAANEIGKNQRVIAAVWRNGALLGVGMLNLAMAENQLHRAEIQKVLVAREGRRRGIARQIMGALEAAAITRGRSLLTLDTRTGGAGDALYRAGGWQEAGRIPGFAQSGYNTFSETTIFWKRIG